jgi:Rod binding domain-containing protein
MATSIAAAAAPAKPRPARDPKLEATSREFEAMYLEQMLDRMFSEVGSEGPLGDNGTGGPVYRSMMVKEYAGSIVKSGGIGLSSLIYDDLIKLQETR